MFALVGSRLDGRRELMLGWIPTSMTRHKLKNIKFLNWIL
jgi:hypothetical protein